MTQTAKRIAKLRKQPGRRGGRPRPIPASDTGRGEGWKGCPSAFYQMSTFAIGLPRDVL
jgi:hypothetical protein